MAKKKYRVRATASLYVTGVVEASSAEEARELALRSSTSSFMWTVLSDHVQLGNNQIDVWAETVEVEREP